MKTVQISESCWRQLKVQAAAEGRTLTSVLEARAELYLSSKTRVTEEEPDDEPAWAGSESGSAPADALCVCGHQAGHAVQIYLEDDILRGYRITRFFNFTNQIVYCYGA